MRLTGADAIAVLEAAERIAYPAPGFAETACAVVRTLIPCDVITFNQVFVAQGRTEFVVQPDDWGQRLRGRRATMERLAHQHPLVVHHLSTGGHLPLRTSDLDDSLWSETELYAEYFAPLGIRWQLSLAIPSPDDMMNVLALSRRDGDFSDRDVAVLRALRPHLTLGCRTSTTASLTHETAVAGGWIVVSVDDDRLVSALSEEDPSNTFVVGQPLPADLAVSTVSDGGVLGPAVTMRTAQPFLVRAAGQGERPQVLLAQPVSLDDSVVLALTPRQRQVLAALADGCTNAQIARRLGIAESTVKKHLEHIFEALEVDNRVAAVARLSA